MDQTTLKTIASLARLKIQDGEIETFLRDFSNVVNFVDQIQEMDTSQITEEEIYPNSSGRTREDKVRDVLTREDLSKMAPRYENGYVVVPKVIET